MATRFAADRFVYVFAPDKRLTSGVGVLLDVFTDEECTTPATITTLDGTPISGAQVAVGADSLLPEFLDTEDHMVLYVRPPNATGPGSAIEARTPDLVEVALRDQVGPAVANYLTDNPVEADVVPSEDEGNLLSLGADGRIFLSATDLPPGATGDHGELTGLGDDDHPQYLNATRGDARYYPRVTMDGLLGGKVNNNDPRLSNARPPTAHSHALADVTGLTAALDAKLSGDDPRLSDPREPLSHTHAVADVTGLQDVLDGKVATSDPRLSDARTPTAHSHAMAEVTGLGGALDGKAGVEHEHELTDVTGLTAALDARALADHGHAIEDVTGLASSLGGKAPMEHSHVIAHVTGLQSALDGKQAAGNYASASHTHTVADISASGTASEMTYLRGDGTWATPAGEGGTSDHGSLTGLGDDDHPQYLTEGRGDARYFTQAQVTSALDGKVSTDDPRLTDARTPVSHQHPVSDVTDLGALLDTKAGVTHTHEAEDLTDSTTIGRAVLTAADAAEARTALGAAGASHTHAISGVTGLQDALDGKQAAGDYATASALTSGLATKADAEHSHAVADVTGLQSVLDGKAATGHTHAIANVTGLQSALDGKAASSHTHAIAHVTGLQTVLDGKQVVGDYATTQALSDGLADKADADHTHDTRYYTQAQVDGALAGKADSTHTHPATDISDSTSVGRSLLTASSTGFARAAINAAPSNHTHIISHVTGLQNALDGKQASGSYATTAEVQALVATTPYIIKWNSATGQWPTRPAAGVVPVGLAWFDSSDDEDATAPSGALSDGSVADKWIRKAVAP